MPRQRPWLICASVCAAGAAHAETLTPFVTELRIPALGRTAETLAWRDGADIRVPRDALAALGIAAANDPASLSAIAGLTWHETPEEAAIVIDCSDACFTVQNVRAQTPRLAITPSEPGAFLNFDLAAAAIAGNAETGGAFEFGVFSTFGAGDASFIARDGEQPIRLDARWLLDFPNARIRASLGDGLTRGGASGAPVRFGGVQIARDFTLDPGFIPFPLPSLTGSAQAPSVVELYVDGALRLRQRIDGGPFSIPDAPVLVGSGDAQIVVTDALGRQTIISAPFYASAALLRPGLSDFSFTLGAERENFARESDVYGRGFISGFYRQGLTDWLTAEARADFSAGFANVGAGASLLAFGFGQIDFAAAASADGAYASLGWRRDTRDFSFGVELEHASPGYARLGDPSGYVPPRLISRAHLAFDTALGQVSLAAANRDARSADAARTLSLAFAPPPSRFGAWSLSAFRVDGDGEHYFSIGLGVSIPLDGDISLGAGADYGDSAVAIRASAARAPPSDGGFGWRARTQTGAAARADLGVLYRGAQGEGDLDASYANGETGVRAQLAGGLIWIDGALYAGRPVRESFALVDLGAPNVGVLRENRLVTRTDANGRALITGLRAYEPNRISIEIDDLPLDAMIDADTRILAPSARSGVRISFGLRLGAGEARVIDAHGAPLPAGASLVRSADGARFPIGSGGRVYLTGMQGREDFTLDASPTCTVHLALQDNTPAVCS